MSSARGLGRWRTEAEIALWRYGWIWLLAAACALAALALRGAVVQPDHLALAEARFELAREAKSLRNPGAVVAPVSNDEQRLAVIQDRLRQTPDAGELVRKMATLAQHQQLVLVQGDYSSQFHSTTQTTQVQINQPIRGTYPQLRRYIEAVLRAVPNAALDQITARRENVGQSQLEARLRWSVWLQQDPSVRLPQAPVPREATQ